MWNELHKSQLEPLLAPHAALPRWAYSCLLLTSLNCINSPGFPTSFKLLLFHRHLELNISKTEHVVFSPKPGPPRALALLVNGISSLHLQKLKRWESFLEPSLSLPRMADGKRVCWFLLMASLEYAHPYHLHSHHTLLCHHFVLSSWSLASLPVGHPPIDSCSLPHVPHRSFRTLVVWSACCTCFKIGSLNLSTIDIQARQLCCAVLYNVGCSHHPWTLPTRMGSMAPHPYSCDNPKCLHSTKCPRAGRDSVGGIVVTSL